MRFVRITSRQLAAVCTSGCREPAAAGDLESRPPRHPQLKRIRPLPRPYFTVKSTTLCSITNPSFFLSAVRETQSFVRRCEVPRCRSTHCSAAALVARGPAIKTLYRPLPPPTHTIGCSEGLRERERGRNRERGSVRERRSVREREKDRER